MKNRHSSRPSLAVGGLTAAVALLAGLSQANAQAPAPGAPLSGAGSFPLSFIVPGTSTSLHVGGFIQLDTSYNMSAFGNAASPGALDNLAPESVELSGNGIGANPPGHTDHGVWRLTAQNTRFLVETRTPTAYGEMKTFIEIDFAGNQSPSGANGTASASAGGTQTNFNQTSVARLKQAYGTLGPWLFGMTNSNFADLAAWSDQLDAPVEAGAFMGAGQVKIPQVRYTYLLPNGISLSGSFEANQSAGEFATNFTGAGAVTWNDFNAPGYAEKYPALTGTAQIQQPWGHAGFHVVVAEERFRNLGLSSGLPAVATATSLFSGAHVDRWGYQVSQTGHFNTIGKDKITWQLQYGQGAANYTWSTNDLGAQWEEGLVCGINTTAHAAINAAGTVAQNIACSQPRDMGVNVGYSHWWNDTWRSGVAGGYDQVSRPNAAGDWGDSGNIPATANALATLERKHYSASANILWTPVPGAQFGLEYIWYRRTVWAGAQGSANRIQGQALFAF